MLAQIGKVKGTTFTFDALHTRGDTTKQVVEWNHADYFVVVKNNTKSLRNRVILCFEESSKLNAETLNRGHGRIEYRKIEIVETSPEKVGYPHCHTCGKITRKRTLFKAGKLIKSSSEEEFFVSSHKISAKTPEFFLYTARQHWSIENRLHYIKDRSMDEDRINVSGGYARIISLLRSMAALALNNSGKSMNCIQRKISADKKILINLINSKSLQNWKLAFL